MARWYIKHGSWWMVQWSFDWWFSLGIHIDLRRRDRYGPYVDVHAGPCILSVGRHPIYTDREESRLTFGRGGEPWP